MGRVHLSPREANREPDLGAAGEIPEHPGLDPGGEASGDGEGCDLLVTARSGSGPELGRVALWAGSGGRGVHLWPLLGCDQQMGDVESVLVEDRHGLAVERAVRLPGPSKVVDRPDHADTRNDQVRGP